MPIRINLLAEAQATEELRRRDPVKRGIWIASFVVFLFLLWSLSLQFKVMSAHSDQRRYENEWKALEKKYNAVLADKKKISQIDAKLTALDRLSTSRFLWGNVLNALQQTVVDQVQLAHFRSDQSYLITPGFPPKKDGEKTIPGKLAVAAENISMTIEARDYGAGGDQNYNKFQTALATFPYFQALLKKSDALRLTNLGGEAETDPADATRMFRRFTLDARLPEVKRNE